MSRLTGDVQRRVVDIEALVNSGYGYDIRGEIVGETGTVGLAETAAVVVRRDGRFGGRVPADWRERFVRAYDAELQQWIGPVPGLRGFVMAAACNAHGVSGSAGLAEHVLESLQPDPSPYVRSLSPGRYLPPTWDWESARAQAQQVYENYYALPQQARQARQARQVP